MADESCARPVIQALREAGHDVVAIAEVAKGATDDQVLEHALKEDRERTAILANWFMRGRSSAGVILLRFHSRVHHARTTTVVEAVCKLGSRLRGRFIVIEPGRVRLSSRP